MHNPLSTQTRLTISRSLLVLLIVSTLATPATSVFASPDTGNQTAPLDISGPSVTISTSPANVQIGADFTINATFSNTSADPGYGPFIDLYIPHGGIDGLVDEDLDLILEDWGIFGDGITDTVPNSLDGISPQSGSNYTATYLGSPVTVTTLTIPDEGTDGRGCVEHPLAIDDASGTHAEVCGYAGDQLVVIELPFGSFTQDQPAATVNIPVHLSNLADLGTPLNIGVRGGFEYGDTPLVDFCCNPLGLTRLSDPDPEGDTWAGTPVTPTIATFTKSSVGDVPTGPNYPRTFSLTLDIAENQTIDNLVFTDTLNANLSYLAGTISCTPAATTCEVVGNALTADFGSVTGTSAGNDAVVTFDFYFNDTVLPSATGGDLGVNNTANFSGTWDTIDSRDPDTPVGGPGVGTATATVISASKSASQNDIIPGDIVKHTISFSVSDYFALENIIIPTDTLSDGQHYFEDGTRFAELTINNNGSSTTVPFTPSNYTVTCNYTGAIADGSTECDTLDAAADDGTTTLTFDISGQITEGNGVTPIHPAGQLLGGHVSDGDTNTDATSGTITYYSEIQDAYTDSTGEASLNSNDQVSNSFSIQGELLDATSCATGTCTNTLGAVQTDGGSTSQSVPKYALNKSVYAVNGTLCSVPNACDDIAPADVTTYRITYDLVSGDFEELKLTDYLPLPIFHVNDPLESGAGSHTWTEDTPGSVVIPAAGQWSRGPADTQYAGQGIDPTVNTNTVNNALIFDFGTYADTSNTAYTIDLLFSATVSDEPFADGLNLTNQVEQSDQNTGSQTSSGTEIVQITLSEPVLVGEKSAVATDNSNVADYSAGGVTFLDPGTSGQPWSGTINSDFLDSYPISADITGVDAGDLVTFVIVVENSGGADGFDVKLKDTLPGGYVFPAGGVNLQVHNGNGDAFGFASLPTAVHGDGRDLFENGIEVVESGSGPGACQAHSIDSGLNVLIISYDLQVDPDAIAGQTIQNLGELVDYSGSEGGPGHLEESQEEGSTTTLDIPTLSKTLIETEINNVNNDDTEVAIGELVKYQLKVTLPEGNIEDLRLIDYLAPYSQNGLAFHSITRFEFRYEDSGGVDQGDASSDISYPPSKIIYPSGSPVYPMTLSNNGQTMTFDFGTLHNANNNDALTEVLVIEYYAIVMNITAMQAGDSLQNWAIMYYDTYTWDEATQTDVLVDNESVGPVQGDAVTVVEPTLTIAKSVANIIPGGSTYDAGDTVRYTFVIENTSGTDAYNVAFTDQFPFDSINGVSKLDLSSPNINIVSDTNGTTPLTAANLEIVDLGTGSGPFQIQLTSATDLTMEPGRKITFTVDGVIYATARAQDLFDNTAYVEWTSLPTTDATQNDGTDEVNRSTDSSVDNDNERTGADGKGGALDDYADNSNTSFTTTAPTILKVLDHSEIEDATNLWNRAVIGEILTYQVDLTIPEGELPNAVLKDHLDNNLAFVNLVGISYGDIGHSSETLTITNNGQDIEIDFGTLTNTPDGNTANETITIQYNVVVLNDSDNYAGRFRNNRAVFEWDTTSSTSSIFMEGNQIRVMEPLLEVTKDALNNSPGKGTDGQYDAGDEVIFTVTFQHDPSPPTGFYVTKAYDVYFEDTLPDPTKFINLVIAVSDSAGILDASYFETVGNVYRLKEPIHEFDVGRVVTITMTGNIYASPFPGEEITNTADLTWTSLPDTNGTPGSGLDEIDRSTYNSTSDERDGSGVGPNNYASQAVKTVQIEDPGASKYVVWSDQGHTADPYLVIGETVRFAIKITLPESTTNNLLVIDELPAGLQFSSLATPHLVTLAGDSGGLLTNDFAFSGNLELDSTTPYTIAGNPQTITFDFDPITVTNDLSTNNNSFLLLFETVVVNTSANNHGDVKENNVSTEVDGNVVAGTPVSVTVIEPEVNIIKEAAPTDPNPDETLTFTIKVENPAAAVGDPPRPDAFEVIVTDVVPAGLTFVSASDTPAGTPASYNSGTNTITWDLGDITNGDPEIVLTYQATADSGLTLGTDIINTADVAWSSVDDTTNSNERDGSGAQPEDDYTNSDSATVTVTRVDLTLSKDDNLSGSPTTPGSTITYTLSYENVGNGDASNVEIEETVPDHTTYTGTGWTCTPDASAGSTCTYAIGTVAAGASGTVDFAVTVDNPLAVGVTSTDNYAIISDDDTNGTDPTPADNETTITTNIDAAPTVTISKDDSKTDVSAGETLVYELIVTNTGDQDTTGVTITETVPAHTNFNASSSTSGWSCADGSPAGTTCTYTVGALSGGSTSVSVDFAVDVFDPFPVGYSTITNTASVTEDDGSSDNDSDSDNVDTSTALVKTVDSTNKTETSGSDVAIGEVVTYSIDITLPEESLTYLLVNDYLPTGLQYVNGTLNVDTSTFDGTLPAEALAVGAGSGGDLSITFDPSPGTIDVNVDGDPGDNTFTITFDALVLNEAVNQNGIPLTNSVDVYLNGSGTPSNSDSADVTIVEPELTISKGNNNATPNLDGTITYTITVSHLGTSTEDAYDISLTDSLPTGLTIDTGSITASSGTASYNSGSPNTITWSGDLPNDGSTLTITYEASIDSGAANPGDALPNNVNITWTSLSSNVTGERTGAGGVDDHSATASSSTTYTTPDLAITKDDGVTNAVPGDTLSYTLTYTNNGNLAATGVVISETVPANTTFNAGGSTAGWSCADGSPATTTCTYTLGTVPENGTAGYTGSVTFAVTIDDPVPSGVTSISNTASIADDGNNGTDPTPTDNSDSDTDTSLTAAPDIAVSKQNGLTNVEANTTTTYTITVENLGNQDATGIDVTDTLPAEVTYVSASANPDGAAASYNSGPHTVTWPAFDLAAGASINLTVTVTVNDPMTAPSITNTVEAYDDNSNGTDTNSTNNTAEDTDYKPTLSKTMVGTSEPTTGANAATGEENVTIGEIVTYDVNFQISGNTFLNNLTLTDTLSEGLAFMDCVSITASLTSITTDISGTADTDFSPICTSPTINDIPAADPSNPIGNGRQVVFNFGNVENTSALDGTVTVQYRAVVLDVPENSFDGSLDNQVVMLWDGGTQNTNGNPTLNIVEPDLDLTKTVNTNTATYLQVVTYTLDVFTTPKATSDAFDVILFDTLPEGLEYVPGSLKYISGHAPTNIDDTDPVNLSVTWDHYPLGQTTKLTFQATVITASHSKQIVNSANVAWSSLPGDVTSPQSVYNVESTERHYDPADPAGLYTTSASATFVTPALPATGFAPGVNTEIPAQPDDKAYADVDGMFLEIPSLGITMPVAGIPLTDGQWDVTWLWDETGYLEGTAFPTTPGNSVLTSHVYLPDGNPGPFVNIHNLMWGDQIIIHYNGNRYVYEVRDLTRVTPENLSVIDHQTYSWLTLLTCQGFQKDSGEYAYRIAVKAVLIAVESE